MAMPYFIEYKIEFNDLNILEKKWIILQKS